MDASQCIQCPDGVCPVHPVVAPSKSPGLLLTVATLVSLATTVGTEAAWAQDTACQVNTVPRTVLGEHIRAAARAHGDFNIVASTNWTRFYSALYLGLVRDAIERRPEGGVLYFSSQSLFREFLPVSGLTPASLAYAGIRAFPGVRRHTLAPISKCGRVVKVGMHWHTVVYVGMRWHLK